MSKLMEIKKDALVHVANYQKALAESDVTTMASEEEAIANLEADYKAESFNQYIIGLRASENPIKACLTDIQYEIIKHRINKDGKVITGIELYATDATVELDKVFDRLGITNNWMFKAVRLNYLYTLKAAAALGIESEEFEKIKSNYIIQDEIRKTIDGETPTSTAKMVSYVQEVIDAILFEAREGDGKNIHRAQEKDVRALANWHTSKDKRSVGTTQVAGDKAFVGFITEMMHMIVTKTGYRLAGKQIEGSRTKARHDVIVADAEEVSTESAPVVEEVAPVEVPAEEPKKGKKGGKKSK